MDRPVDTFEDDCGRLIRIELEPGFVSGEGELICCCREQPPVLFGRYYHETGGEERKERLESPNSEAKNGAYKTKRPQFE